MPTYAKDEFVPKNPAKYFGGYPIIYRSSWELSMMNVFDTHPSITGWASEPLEIPYQNPITGKFTVYIPDFIVMFTDKDNRKRVEMIEVKPAKEVPGYNQRRIDKKTKLAQAVNLAKWEAATRFCVKRGWHFRVATEDEMFAFKRKKR